MRTAKEILQSFDDSPYIYFPTVIEIINQARKEAIEECNKIVNEADRLLNRAYNNNHDDMGWDNDYQIYIDKKSIIKLIKELK